MTSRKSRNLRPEEKQLWDKVKKSAVPLHKPDKEVLAKAIDELPSSVEPQPLPTFRIGQNPAAAREGRATSLPLHMDSKKFGQMKKGKLVPEARLDLHGMNMAQAQPELISFILNAHSRGKRLVLIITGKGRVKHDGGPVPERTGILKRFVPQWLAQPPIATVVQQYSEAHTRHGGSGALYVYLRRHR